MFPSWTWAGWAGSGMFQRASYPHKLVESLHATPAVQVGVLSKNAESTMMWKDLDELPSQQSGSQLVVQNIALTGWTFKATVSEKEKHKTRRIRDDLEFIIILPNNVLVGDYSFKLHRGAMDLVDGGELLAMPLYWEFDANCNQAEMPVLLLYPTSRKIDSREMYERVGRARCFFRNNDLTVLNEEVDSSRLPSWARGVFQTVYIS
jgi:hypothetical protein